MIKKFNDFINEGKYEEDHELNRILDKISDKGIDSITPEEKAYLDGEVPEEKEYDGTYSPSDPSIAANGEYLDPDKKDFLFKVYDVDQDEFYSPSNFAIAVFDKDGKYMIDQHVSDELFPELSRIGLEDAAEGELEYIGRLTKNEVIQKLQSMGFNVVASNRPY